MSSAVSTSKCQVLITGVYRTGSEYLSLLLSGHPCISVSMYRINVLRFMYGRYDPIGVQKNITRAIQDTQNRINERYEMDLDVDAIHESLRTEKSVDYGGIYNAIMNQLYVRDGITHWAEKNQLLWREIPVFIDFMPNGKAVHIIRDPRSVLASFKKYTRYPEPAYLGAIFNCYDSMVTSLRCDNDRVKTVIYEDLVTNPLEQILSVCEFLELDTSKYSMDSITWVDTYGRPWNSNSSYQRDVKHGDFDLDRAVNGWRNDLSHEEINAVEFICDDVMSGFGYQTVTDTSMAEIEKLIGSDPRLQQAFSDWQLHGIGMEEFPANPLDKSTWG